MNKLILCEGKTDAILLSYYLEQTCGWKYLKTPPAGLDIKVDAKNGETAEWYQKNSDRLLICAVGSKDGFGRFFDHRVYRPLFDSDAFSKIALMIDRDDESVAEIEADIRTSIPSVAGQAENNCWVVHKYHNGFGEFKQLSFLLLIIPHNHQGALEALLLDAVSEDDYDRNIVEKSRAYVDRIAPEAERYIGKQRLKQKAYLGVTWAIQSPQKVFHHIDEQIRAVRWERSVILDQCFSHLREI